MAEDVIRRQLQDLAKALSAKDIDGAMSVYAPTVVSFDINPPLQYAGADIKRQAWLEAFAAYAGGFSYEIPNPSVTTQGGLAFVHSLNHVTGTLANGRTTDMWVRWTACFRRVDGVWLIVHDHVSVPADLAQGKAVTNLTRWAEAEVGRASVLVAWPSEFSWLERRLAPRTAGLSARSPGSCSGCPESGL